MTRLSGIAVVALILAACTRPRPPDVVLLHGKIFTADSTAPWVDALAITEGRIVALGLTDSIRSLAGPHTRVLDLGGRVVIPGINDAHVHAGPTSRRTEIRAPGAALREVVDSLAAARSRRPRGTWLFVTVGDRVLDDPRANRFFLDSIVPDHPTALESWAGHAAIVNSAALGVLGLGQDVADPLGGRFGRAGRAGGLDGRLTEYAWWGALRRTTMAIADSESRSHFRTYAAAAARFGITSIQDMNTGLTTDRAIALLKEAELPIRWRVIRFPMTGPGARDRADLRNHRARPGAMIDVSGTKYILDGTPVEYGAALRRPYRDRPERYGELNFPLDTLRAIIAEALRSRDQLMVHAVGDSAIQLLLSLMSAAAPDSTWRGLRPRLEHGDVLPPDLVPLVRRLGVVVVQNPAHFTLRDLARRRLAPEVAASAQPLRSLWRAGIPVAIGSDGPMNPYLNIMFAVTHPLNPAEALTREEAVTAYTTGSAYAAFAERDIGSLAPGKLADLAVLSQDVFTVPIPQLPTTESVLTLVGGGVVYDAGVVK